jgi:hypothetical protein
MICSKPRAAAYVSPRTAPVSKAIRQKPNPIVASTGIQIQVTSNKQQATSNKQQKFKT